MTNLDQPRSERASYFSVWNYLLWGPNYSFAKPSFVLRKRRLVKCHFVFINIWSAVKASYKHWLQQSWFKKLLRLQLKYVVCPFCYKMRIRILPLVEEHDNAQTTQAMTATAWRISRALVAHNGTKGCYGRCQNVKIPLRLPKPIKLVVLLLIVGIVLILPYPEGGSPHRLVRRYEWAGCKPQLLCTIRTQRNNVGLGLRIKNDPSDGRKICTKNNT